jgi:hypothetical protein
LTSIVVAATTAVVIDIAVIGVAAAAVAVAVAVASGIPRLLHTPSTAPFLTMFIPANTDECVAVRWQ